MSRDRATATAGPELPGLRCISLLGAGGYAEVYLYERERPRTQFAVKVMSADTMDEAKRRQFVAEADVMAELADHPYIVSIYDAGTTPDGRPYLVMQYYQSKDLAVRIAREPLTVQEALRYGIQLASAVETAHRANVIHRDIKPSNVLLDSYGKPGLSDFGIAGHPESGDDEVGVSIPWSPPEVLSGASNGSVTSDVYSLAATIWTLLVGRSPFELPGGDNGRRAMATRIVHSRPPATGRGDVPASLDRLLQQALAKDPAHRPQSARELARNLQRVEQELRLARTEVPLLDHPSAASAPAAPAAPATDSAPASPSDATRQRPAAVPPANMESASETRRKARRVEPGRPQADQPAHTVWGPKASEPPNAPVSSPGLGRAASQPTVSRPATQPTVRRPAAAVPEAPTPTSQPTGGGRRGLITSLAVVALVVVVGAVVALSAGAKRGGTGGGHTTEQSNTVGSDVLPSASTAPPDPSSVTGTVKGQRVTFTWPAVSGVSEYSYGVGLTTGATHVTVPRAARGKTCIVVHSVQPGAPVTNGTRGCVS